MTAAPIALPAVVSAPLLVWVLAPVVETDDENVAWYADYTQSKAEYDRAFAALGHEWRWQPITLATHREVIAAIVRESRGYEPVILNLCDGDEVNGSPGLRVIRCLEEHGLRYTGADERFYDVTTSKIVMKEACDRAGVPTSPVNGGGKIPPRSLLPRLRGSCRRSRLRGLCRRCERHPPVDAPSTECSSAGEVLESSAG